MNGSCVRDVCVRVRVFRITENESIRDRLETRQAMIQSLHCYFFIHSFEIYENVRHTYMNEFESRLATRFIPAYMLRHFSSDELLTFFSLYIMRTNSDLLCFYVSVITDRQNGKEWFYSCFIVEAVNR